MHTDIELTSELDVRPIRVQAADDMVVQAMLVSTQGELSLDAEATFGRINFLMRNRHGTPFEHNSFTFYIAAPIFVFREFHRHRIGFSYNEESGRYKQLEPKFYMPPRDRELVQVGKPGEYTYLPGTTGQYTTAEINLRDTYATAYRAYERMLANNIAKEVARMCLPVGIYSSMYCTCNARSIMAFLSLRRRLSSEEALFPSTPMKEIDWVAQRMEDVFATSMPLTYQAFVDNFYVAP